MVFMAFMTIWALILNQGSFGAANNLLLQIVNGVVLLIAVWIVVEGVIKIFGSDDTAAPAGDAA